MNDSKFYYINIKVGDKCNLKCLYCIQNDEKKRKRDMPEELNLDLIKFIRKRVKDRVIVHFSGGEPLLYYKIIKYIVGLLKHPNIEFSIETNGTLLTNDIVEWLNSNNFKVIVSWDGRHSNIIRGIDIFQNDILKKLVFKLNQVYLQGLITSLSYPYELVMDFEQIYNEYILLNPKGAMHKQICELTDFCIENRDIMNLDFDKIKEDIYTLKKNNYGNWFLDNYNMRFTKDKLSTRYAGFIKINNIFVDLAGNLFPLTTSRIILGNISTMSDAEYIQKCSEFDIINEKFNDGCDICKYRNVCTNYNRMMYISSIGGDRILTCRLKKIIYDTVISFNTL